MPTHEYNPSQIKSIRIGLFNTPLRVVLAKIQAKIKPSSFA
jgi:hypothetical protein